jgi:hypothetical protein
MRFRRALLNTVPSLGALADFMSMSMCLSHEAPITDALAHIVVPSLPKLKPHGRILHHFRFLLPLFQKDGDGLTPIHYYDAAIQLARNSFREPTEEEFEAGIRAADEIIRMYASRVSDPCSLLNRHIFSLDGYRMEMMLGTSSQLDLHIPPT